jgi:hypothetical protein
MLPKNGRNNCRQREFIVDVSQPPHFHAKRRGQWEVRIYFQKPETEMLEIKWLVGRISKKDKRSLCDMASNLRPELLIEWEEKVRYAD